MTATSDGAGNFTFNELPPSTYKLEVTRDGFKTKVLDGVHILAEQANCAERGAGDRRQVRDGDRERREIRQQSIPKPETSAARSPRKISRRCLTLAATRCNWLNWRPACLATVRRTPAAAHYSLPGNQGDGSAGASYGPVHDREQAAGLRQWRPQRHERHHALTACRSPA